MQTSLDIRETMFIKVREWQSSGISQKAFCEKHDIRYHVFHYWYKLYRGSNDEINPEPGHFVQLDVPSISSDIFAEISFTSGNKVILHQPVSSDYIKALL